MTFSVFIMRAFLKEKLPRRIFVFLWYASAIRFLFPFELKSKLNVYSLISPSGEAVRMPSLSLSQRAVMAPEAVPAEDYLKMIWLTGAAVFLVIFISAHIFLLLKVSKGCPFDCDLSTVPSSIRPRRRVKFFLCPGIESPFTSGIIRPRIYFPNNYKVSEEVQLKYILIHEFVHIKRFDCLGKALLYAALCVNWFNPLLYIMVIYANRDIEISCDEAVLAITGERKAYALSLLAAEEKRSQILSVNGFSKNIVKERVEHIMKNKKSSKKIQTISASIIMSAVMASLSSFPASGQTAGKADSSHSFIWPVRDCYDISLKYGEISAGGKVHNELDIGSPDADGSDVLAVLDGTVENVGFSYEGGNFISIDHGNGIETVYSSCNEIYAAPGDFVSQGDVIASVGSTGLSTGAHLGFSVINNGEYVDPMEFYQ